MVVVYPCCLQKISIHFACFPTSIELAFGSNSDACYGTQTCSLRNFLKAAVLHYFPSRVKPEFFTRHLQMLIIGNNLRLDGIHLRLVELFSVDRYLAPLPILSSAVLVMLPSFTRLGKHSEA